MGRRRGRGLGLGPGGEDAPQRDLSAEMEEVAAQHCVAPRGKPAQDSTGFQGHLPRVGPAPHGDHILSTHWGPSVSPAPLLLSRVAPMPCSAL